MVALLVSADIYRRIAVGKDSGDEARDYGGLDVSCDDMKMIAPGPIKILIVDDEIEVCDSLRRVLALKGYDIETATDPYTALRLIHRDNFLIVISDISMPGMSGVELLERIKKYNGMIQVLMMTGYVTLDNIMACMRLGADECFLKPIRDMRKITDAVKDCHGKLRRWNRIMLELSQGNEQVED
jgi:DNA-binding NtrC family response regulator